MDDQLLFKILDHISFNEAVYTTMRHQILKPKTIFTDEHIEKLQQTHEYRKPLPLLFIRTGTYLARKNIELNLLSK